jgi:dTDP-4-amino-4,6-dideoxygalactose transaminase
MLTTDSDEWAERIRIMRLHGIDADVYNRGNNQQPRWYYEVVAPGFKYNMTDVAAAIGLHQLARQEAFRDRRQAIAQRYTAAFAALPLQLPPATQPGETDAWHLYVIRLTPAAALGRDATIQALADRGVGASVHFIPLHIQPYWRDRYGFAPDDFPAALAAYDAAISLPIFPAMTDAQVDAVIDAVTAVLTG